MCRLWLESLSTCLFHAFSLSTVSCVIMMTLMMTRMMLIKSYCVSAKRALQLCSVPLDVAYSLQSLRSALSESAYTARALQNSRQLLALYLAGSTKLPDTGNDLPANISCGLLSWITGRLWIFLIISFLDLLFINFPFGSVRE